MAEGIWLGLSVRLSKGSDHLIAAGPVLTKILCWTLCDWIQGYEVESVECFFLLKNCLLPLTGEKYPRNNTVGENFFHPLNGRIKKFSSVWVWAFELEV